MMQTTRIILSLFVFTSLTVSAIPLQLETPLEAGVDWKIVTVDSDGSVGSATSLALDSNDLPHIAYYDYTNRSVNYARWTGNEWVSEEVDYAGSTSNFVSIAIDSNNRPHISYHSGEPGNDLKYAKWNGSEWKRETVLSGIDWIGMDSSIALDSKDYPHISFDHGGPQDLMYARWNGTNWSIETVDSHGNVGWFNSIELDSNYYPHISYYSASEDDLKYARWNGTNWSIETVDDEGCTGWGTSLDLDSSDRPHISYSNCNVVGIDNELRYAWWTGKEWRLDVIDTEWNVGLSSSIALDNDNSPHFSYYDKTHGYLKYAKWNSTGWENETVDIADDAGHSSSLALDSNGKPHASYYSGFKKNLLYATKANLTANLPPVANSGGSYGGKEGGSMVFDGSSSSDPEGRPLSFTWDFDALTDSDGDGDFVNDVDATGPTPTHIYYDNGDYTVTLTVTDDSGQSDTDTSVATVLNVAPTANADGPYEGNEPHTVHFIGIFTDPGTLDTHTFQWDFDFDGITFDVDSTEQSPTRQWQDDFNGDVAFKVSDDDGGWDLDVTHVTICNLPPKATANGPYKSFEGTPIQFTGNHTDPGLLDTHTYEWDFSYDGTTFNPDATGNPYEKTWYDDYSGNIALRVTDDDGGWGIDITNVTIGNVPPKPEWTSKTADGTIVNPPYPEGKKIQFDATVDDPGIDDTFTYDWDFGDGTVILDAGPSVVHAFGDNDSYLVILTVTDDDGGVGIDDTPQLDIYNVDPDTDLPIPLCIFYEGPSGCDLFGTFSDLGWLDTHMVYWEFGDGLTDSQVPIEENDPPDATGNFTTTHVYGDDGDYKVNATVIDDDGGENTSRAEIHITNVPPSLSISESSPIDEGQSVSITVNATDPGSDDIYLVLDWGDGTSEKRTYYNNGIGPDPPQSPLGNYPFNVIKTLSHIYGDNGVYKVTVTIADDDGGETNESINITVLNVAPSISPFGPFVVDESASLALDATSADPGSDDLTFTWEFEMGVTVSRIYYNDGAGPDPYPSPGGIFPFTVTDTANHVYGDNGIFNVTLTVEDDDGGNSTYKTNITVNNLEPTISPFGPFTVDEGSPLEFNATATDPGSDDLTFTWVFEYGPTLVDIYYNDGIGPDPYPSPEGKYPFEITDDAQHTYGDNSIFNVTLTVEDDDGGSASYMTIITVNNVAPSIAPFGPFSIDEGSPLVMAASSTDPGSDDLTFTWELELGPTITKVYYNDGIGPDPYPSPGGNFPFTVEDIVQHTYGDDGLFNVTLTVDDDDGSTASYKTTITVDNVAPTVDVQAYIPVNFTLRITGEKWHNVEMFIYSDNEEIGYAEITRYPGNPDEQTVATGFIKCDITSTITARVLYTPLDDPISGTINGANPVWLMLTFEDDTEVRLKHTFNVQHEETWEWSVDINPYLSGHEITFEATATDPGSDDLTFTWNWGDGSLDNETIYYNDGVGPDLCPSPGGTYPFTATDVQKHTFTTSGVHTVTLTVEDDDGGITRVAFVLII